jgi:aconitate hydratase
MRGDEQISISGLADLRPRQTIEAIITFADGSVKTVPLTVRIDTEDELEYYRHGGILHYVLRNLVGEKQAA